MNEIIKKNGITFGVITGLVSILTTTLIYSIDLNLFTSWWIGLLNIFVYLAIGIILLSKTKKEIGNFFTFKNAFTTYFISIVIGIALAVTFNIILFNVVDPGAKDTIKELTIKFAVQMLEKFNTPTKVINKAVQEMQAVDQFSIGQLIKGGLFNIAFGSVFGLVLAAIFKSKTPQGLS